MKSFLKISFLNEFHSVVGQYLNYAAFLQLQEPDRILFLAVPLDVYEKHFLQPAIEYIINKFALNLIVYNSQTKVIVQWLVK